MASDEAQIDQLIKTANVVAVLQADNPDSDSLGSALALEEILAQLGKEVHLYCGMEIPTYLRYMEGADRVRLDLPKQFDLSIVVDASTQTLFERLEKSGQQAWLGTRPSIILDHHASTDHLLPFATVIYNQPDRSSTGELIYRLAKTLGWPLNREALNLIANAILGDTQGLSNKLASAETYRIMAELIEAGVNRPELEELRRASSKMPETIYRYKGELIKRTKLSDSLRVAYVSVPQDEINRYSPLYNPAPLIQGDMLQVEGVKVAIVFKVYEQGKVTGSIRSNPDAAIAAQLAEHFDGGGHSFASGFKIDRAKDVPAIINECVSLADKLLEADENI